ncbi:MAG: undecaprenyl/decaprenyl-phosphate alpha-N-acetylglucosaminyl 1-phosphate transferase [Treponema sp.]|jgi:UDP-GlcNAc:undecaprenyl-phosphate GlcNAc-1-phosphate transferase|nr:undecaprenyl/decaprenyl-phosphate alpha-N-acetylglucosaminyl 1-phosphate transferase [Treponema sp.]
MVKAIIFFFVSFVLSSVAVSLVLRLSIKYSWFDHINERKIHSGNIPRLGGIGFAGVFILVALFINFFTGDPSLGLRSMPVFVAMILILASGVYDDFRPLSSRYKLAIQIIAALCVIIPDYTFHRLFYFKSGLLSDLNWVRYPLTLFWIVGLTNAINFIDGIDGLAGGLSALAAFTFSMMSFLFSGFCAATLFGLCLTGAICGFLVFNAPFPRAKIFMGDGGSQFLGFTLAVLPLIDKQDSVTTLPLFYAAAVLAIPIFDTVAAVWRRVRDRRRIDSPDKYHVHHKLLKMHLNAQEIDVIIYCFQILLGILVYLAIQAQNWLSLGILGTAYLVILIFFTVIHFVHRRTIIIKNQDAVNTPGTDTK